MITVVVASYKYGHLAAHCIESILSQTVQPAHIMFVDDGVGDCTHLPSLYPEVEYIFRDKNLGTVSNFQDMLMRVRSEYVMFIGADNWFRSDAIEVLSPPVTDIVTYDIMVTGELKGKLPPSLEAPEVSCNNGDLYWTRTAAHHGSMLYRTKLGQEIGYEARTFSGNQPNEDWHLWQQMRKRGATLAYHNQALLYYRRHRENFLKYSTQ
jgi:glycosyltransferase involved in cell wall biosynthesis